MKMSLFLFIVTHMKTIFSALGIAIVHFALVVLHYTGVVTSLLKVIGQPGIWFANKMGWYGWGSAEGTLATIGAFAKGGENPEWPISFWLCMVATSIIWGIVLAIIIKIALKKVK